MLVVLVIGAAGVVLYQCAQIGSYEIRYRDTLNGKPLPYITLWVLQYRSAFMLTGLFIPCAAAATFALRERWMVTTALILLLIIGGLEGQFLRLALRMPFVKIITQLGPA
jgi:hypothetical protein